MCVCCLIGASLSEPHTSVTSLHTCVCMFAWILFVPTTYHKSLPALILDILHHALIQKKLEKRVEDVNLEQSTSLMATTRTETTHGLTYLVSRVTEVTAWQSVDAVCLCCLTHSSCHWTQISSGYSNGGCKGLRDRLMA